MHDVRGWQIDCKWYTPCPLCYGCRAYDPSYKRCEKCANETKQNICNTHKHRADLLAKMIQRETIIVK
jgi:hypothetical protein